LITKVNLDESQMSNMKIQLANLSHCDEIYQLLKACGQSMRDQGVMQWNEKYPLKSHVISDIEHKAMHCLSDNEQILGIVVLDEKQSPEYTSVAWEFHAQPILVVHRFAVLPEVQKGGMGTKLMDFAENFGHDEGYQSIRLDAYSGNARTLKFYNRRGYKKVGEVNFPYRTLHFDCLEKKL
jgi:ribosomal protein S18 acetylase RimI-like enzyme